MTAMDVKAIYAIAVDAKAAAVTGTAAWRVRWRRRVRWLRNRRARP
jgi:hypothetical protein